MRVLLADYAKGVTTIVTLDGRVFEGVIVGVDQTCNVLIDPCAERTFSAADSTYQAHPLGATVVRGDNVAFAAPLSEVDDAVLLPLLKQVAVSAAAAGCN